MERDSIDLPDGERIEDEFRDGESVQWRRPAGRLSGR